jgi:hypothetical protein
MAKRALGIVGEAQCCVARQWCDVLLILRFGGGRRPDLAASAGVMQVV